VPCFLFSISNSVSFFPCQSGVLVYAILDIVRRRTYLYGSVYELDDAYVQVLPEWKRQELRPPFTVIDDLPPELIDL